MVGERDGDERRGAPWENIIFAYISNSVVFSLKDLKNVFHCAQTQNVIFSIGSFDFFDFKKNSTSFFYICNPHHIFPVFKLNWNRPFYYTQTRIQCFIPKHFRIYRSEFYK